MRWPILAAEFDTIRVSTTRGATTMPITSLNPYLNFSGNADQAIALYERALGAKTEMVMRYGEAQGMEVPPEHRDRVMHATLDIAGSKIMISDAQPGEAVASSNAIHVALHFKGDLDDVARKFDALAEGGEVTMPLADTFWGARFGTLTDAFGIRWMFNA
jgi:PhnB protein